MNNEYIDSYIKLYKSHITSINDHLDIYAENKMVPDHSIKKLQEYIKTKCANKIAMIEKEVAAIASVKSKQVVLKAISYGIIIAIMCFHLPISAWVNSWFSMNLEEIYARLMIITFGAAIHAIILFGTWVYGTINFSIHHAKIQDIMSDAEFEIVNAHNMIKYNIIDDSPDHSQNQEDQ